MGGRPRRRGVLLRDYLGHRYCQVCRASSSERNLRRPELYVRGKNGGNERGRDGPDVK
jgi:hypothetical protein